MGWACACSTLAARLHHLHQCLHVDWASASLVWAARLLRHLHQCLQMDWICASLALAVYPLRLHRHHVCRDRGCASLALAVYPRLVHRHHVYRDRGCASLALAAHPLRRHRLHLYRICTDRACASSPAHPVCSHRLQRPSAWACSPPCASSALLVEPVLPHNPHQPPARAF